MILSFSSMILQHSFLVFSNSIFYWSVTLENWYWSNSSDFYQSLSNNSSFFSINNCSLELRVPSPIELTFHFKFFISSSFIEISSFNWSIYFKLSEMTFSKYYLSSSLDWTAWYWVNKFIETSFSTARVYFNSVISFSKAFVQSLNPLFSDSNQSRVNLSSCNFESSVQISASALCFTLSSLI